MATKYRVTCIVKPNVFSPHEHITHIGGNGWTLTRAEAIRQIDSGTSEFYVKDPVNGEAAYVGVVREAGKVPYLRTYADGDWNDNLLSLNQCAIG